MGEQITAFSVKDGWNKELSRRRVQKREKTNINDVVHQMRYQILSSPFVQAWYWLHNVNS